MENKIEYCIEYNESLTDCLKCQSFYILKEGLCINIPSNQNHCEEINSGGLCLKCKNGYGYNQADNKCFKPKFPFINIEKATWIKT